MHHFDMQTKVFEVDNNATAPILREVRITKHPSIFWSRADSKEAYAMLRAAQRYELNERNAGSRCGPLGHVALEVLELLVNHIEADPTARIILPQDQIALTLRRARGTVVRALANLRAHGFLD